jgi:hypothetical protein
MTDAKKADDGKSAEQRIDARIAELGDWRGETLARIRKLIKEADPDVTEDWKWRAYRCGITTGCYAPERLTKASSK